MKIDATHAMYQPDKRASKPRRKRIEETVMPIRNGTRAEKEAWMREKQAAKSALQDRLIQTTKPRPKKDPHARSIIGALLKRHGIPSPRPVEPIYDPTLPDESGVWNI